MTEKMEGVIPRMQSVIGAGQAFSGRMFRPVILAVLLVAMGGCSIKFAYNNLDRLIRWQVGDYVDLNREQKQLLNADIEKTLYWHRTTHLPQYAQYLEQLAVEYSDAVTSDQLGASFARFLSWGEEVQAKVMPVTIEIMFSLTDEQVAKLPAKLEQSNVEIAEEEVGEALEDIQAQWADEFADALKRFVGKLDREQRAYIVRRSMAYQPERILWADYRRRWQTDLLELFDQRKDRALFENAFRELVAQRESYYGDLFSKVSEDNIALSREVAAHLLSNLSDKQSQKFTATLLDLSEDFAELAEQV